MRSFSNTDIDQEVKDSFSISRWEHHNESRLCRIIYHRIFLIEEGSGRLQIDDANYPVNGREVFLLAKGQLYSFLPGSDITGYELSFGDCFWEKTPASASNCKAALFNDVSANQHLKGYTPELSVLFETLYHEFLAADYINKPDALAAYLKIIMIKIANLNAALMNGYESYDNRLYRQFIELVMQKYQTTHEVAGFAILMGITARKLTDICKQYSGKGAKDIINARIITEAKRFLQFSTTPIKEIAFHLNFSTPEQFSHFFKKNTGASPQEYRTRFVQIGM